MLLFWKLVDETQMSKSLEATRHHDLTKLLIPLTLKFDSSGFAFDFNPSKAWNFNPSENNNKQLFSSFRRVEISSFRRVEISSIRRVEIKRTTRWIEL